MPAYAQTAAADIVARDVFNWPTANNNNSQSETVILCGFDSPPTDFGFSPLYTRNTASTNSAKLFNKQPSSTRLSMGPAHGTEYELLPVDSKHRCDTLL